MIHQTKKSEFAVKILLELKKHWGSTQLGKAVQYLLYFLLCFRQTGKTTKALNLGSYNYLGFAENVGPCAETAEESVKKYGLGGCSSRHEYGK